jgi:hypothetical protein
MSDSADTIARAEPEDSASGETGSATPAVVPSRRIVGVVRVLRGRLAAPCRCCSDLAAEELRHAQDE